MWVIKKGRPQKDTKEDEGPHWQLASSGTQDLAAGTVFGIGPDGQRFMVDRVPVTVKTSRSAHAIEDRVRATLSAYARFLGLDPSMADAQTEPLDHCKLELHNEESEAVDEEEFSAQLNELLAKLGKIYRADSRYFVVRGTISAPAVVPHFSSDQVTRLFRAKPAAETSLKGLSREFSMARQVAVLLDEVLPVRSNLGSGSPKLGLVALKQPLPEVRSAGESTSAPVHSHAQPTSNAVSEAEDVTVPWVTAVVDPIEVADTKTIAIAQPVSMETHLGLAAGEGELAAIGISQDLLKDAGIQFKVVLQGAQGRPQDKSAAWATSLLSPELRFEPPAPTRFAFQIQADAPGNVGLRVVLYLNGRPTLSQQIALTAVERVAPAAIEAPRQSAAAPFGCNNINGRNLATLPAPAITLEIGDHDHGYPIELTIAGRRAERPAVPAIERADLESKTIAWRKQLVALSEQYGHGTHDELATETPDALRAFARIGAEIHQALFGRPKQRGIEDLRRMADAIAQLGATNGQRALMTISAERLPLPWGIVYDGELADEKPVDLSGFWGHRFLIERIAPAVLEKIPARALREAKDRIAQLVPCINPHLDSQQKVVAASNQRAFFETLAEARITCHPVVQTREALGLWLAKDHGESRLVYFFCHASSAKTIDDRYFQSTESSDKGTWLDLDADKSLHIDINWLRKAREERLAGQPLIFLNACSTAEGDREFQSPFLTQFVREYDARGLIGSDWKIPTVFADAFARRFLRRFLGGTSLGQALIATSDEFMAAGNPFPLIYAIYGRTDIVVSEENT
ncbi:MAG: CHAT domain-containing protein [Myxococcales bacterium]|nr:CHAT domain-containing protein [Myxococcales bacterium]